LLPNFSSNLANIGCDETFDVGQGRSRAAVSERGYAQVYADYVNRVAAIARKHAFRPMFWADIALTHPEALDLLNKEMIALAWGYEPDAPFAHWGKMLKDRGFEFWVCPGTSSWRSITGRASERQTNLIAAAEQGAAFGASGFMVTDWGDMGHRQQFPISLHALAEAANAAWNTDAAENYNPQASSWHAFNDKTGTTGKWLDEVGDVDFELRCIAGKKDRDGRPIPLRNSTCLFNDLHAAFVGLEKPGSFADWEMIRERLDALNKRFPTGLDEQIEVELRHTLDVTRFAADRAIASRLEKPLTRGQISEFIDRMRAIIAEHRRLWLRRCRPGGLDDSCGYYELVIEDLERSLE